MKKLYKKYLALLIILVILSGVFFVGFRFGVDNTKITSNEIFSVNSSEDIENGVDFTSFWKVWNVINSKFRSSTTTKEITNQDKVWGAISGLVGSTGDPYTVFFPPEEAKIFEENINGSFSGVGMQIDMKEDTLIVISPLKGTPAAKAGILSGDRVIAIDGENILGIKIEEAIKKIRGERGTPVVLSIIHEGESESVDIEIIRDNIEIPVMDTKLREDGIFVIELYSFSATSPNLFEGALKEFLASGSKELILDLRGNAGGYLEAAIDIASWFLSEGQIIVTEDYGENNEGKNKIHRSRGYNLFNENLKFIILTDVGSASASEILAGALQEHGVARLVGTNTFGKGSVQELVDITDGSTLKITVAQWLTPNGKSISDGGLTPDYEVEYTKENKEAKEDPQLQKAVEILLGS